MNEFDAMFLLFTPKDELATCLRPAVIGAPKQIAYRAYRSDSAAPTREVWRTLIVVSSICVSPELAPEFAANSGDEFTLYNVYHSKFAIRKICLIFVLD